jgi:hypothetical protein
LKNIKGTEKLLFTPSKLTMIFNSTFKVSKFFNSSTPSIKVANGNFDFFFQNILNNNFGETWPTWPVIVFARKFSQREDPSKLAGPKLPSPVADYASEKPDLEAPVGETWPVSSKIQSERRLV